MKFYNVYTLDIFSRSTYIFISFIFCWIIFFYYRETLFLLEVLPFVVSTVQKRFIATHLIHLFNTTWFLCTILSFIFIFPLVIKTFELFFSSSWYNYQKNFYNNLLTILTKIFLIFNIFNQLFLLPCLISFFLYWEILDEYSLLKVEAEIALFFYIKWVFTFKFLFSFLTTLLIFFITSLFFLFSSKNLYFILVIYKKNIIFVIIFVIMFLVPPDFLLQILLTFLVVLSVELFLFFTCIKIFFVTKNQLS